ncbi:ComEC/Rec2 family competence protein [Sutcliffiella deserti]|uniref:ComEC/Rec2 family competence protein n=1 Tax=Sutcliffiella deserti TaxID=2875501 RepID=UPI001CBE0894|nr:hypothetical protein [Sutcliffiella deserti]
MWNILVISILIFNVGFLQPIIPNEVEKVDLQLKEEEIAFTFFDLIDGESTLIQTPAEETILINTGSPKSEEEILNNLEVYGVNEISYLVITSTEPEYIGNLESIKENYEVEHFIFPKGMKNNKNIGTPIYWEKGKRAELAEDLQSKVINEGISGDENNVVMDILFEYKGTFLLFMSSANSMVEKRLIKEIDLSVVNILKVGDFANKYGTSEAFLESCDPQIAIIFKNGKGSGVGEVVERLHETWLDIYQTAQIGNVTIKLSDHDYQVITLTLNTFHQIS